jgi:hypothetical protein
MQQTLLSKLVGYRISTEFAGKNNLAGGGGKASGHKNGA